jgi:hypothetical protein
VFGTTVSCAKGAETARWARSLLIDGKSIELKPPARISRVPSFMTPKPLHLETACCGELDAPPQAVKVVAEATELNAAPSPTTKEAAATIVFTLAICNHPLEWSEFSDCALARDTQSHLCATSYNQKLTYKT